MKQNLYSNRLFTPQNKTHKFSDSDHSLNQLKNLNKILNFPPIQLDLRPAHALHYKVPSETLGGEMKFIYLIVAIFLLAACEPMKNTMKAADLSSKSNSLGGDALNIEDPVGDEPIDVDCNFNGEVIADGASVIAYQEPIVDHDKTCVQEVRTCADGELSGTFTSNICTVSGELLCEFNGQVLHEGQSTIAFKTETTPYGTTCEAENRTCSFGQLLGTYEHSTCNVGEARSCVFNNQVIAHGDSTTAYSSPTAASCSTETRTCYDGTLSGSYAYAGCQEVCPDGYIRASTGLCVIPQCPAGAHRDCGYTTDNNGSINLPQDCNADNQWVPSYFGLGGEWMFIRTRCYYDDLGIK